MCSLDFVNQIVFKEKIKSEKLSRMCYENILDVYTEQVFFILSIKNAMSRYILVLTLGIMFYVTGKTQTNIINWGFFVLSILNFAFIAKADNKPSTIKHSLNIANIIKIYSAFFLLLDICFIVFIGEEEKVDQPESID